MKKIIFLSLVTILFITGCKKHADPPCTTNATSISGSYKITAVTYKANASSPEMDYFNILFPYACERDDIYTFQANGSYQIKDAGTVCSPAGDDDGTWSVSGNSMVIDGDATTIESFNCKTLVFVNMDTQTSGDKLKFTLTKQ
ncbi:MAG TPA: lipocalin family protein [Chitinophagaceae bacterium]|nr:lipocalin family protein [Chitinophagaceae bacterium]